ncbi:hypothetical protein V8E36_008445 [Tilletia maclaganii]
MDKRISPRNSIRPKLPGLRPLSYYNHVATDEADAIYTEWYYLRKSTREPELGAILAVLRQRHQRLSTLSLREFYSEEGQHFAHISTILEPLDANGPWRRVEPASMPDIWKRQQQDLLALGLLRFSCSPQSTLSLKLSCLPTHLQDAIHQTKLLGDSLDFPLISILPFWDHKIRLQFQSPPCKAPQRISAPRSSSSSRRMPGWASGRARSKNCAGVCSISHSSIPQACHAGTSAAA